MKKHFLFMISLLLTLSICGCAADAAAESAAAAVMPSATEISTPAPTIESTPEPTPTPTLTPGLFDNADATLNGCNNKGIAAVTKDTLYLQNILEPFLLLKFDIAGGKALKPDVIEKKEQQGGYALICGYGGNAFCFTDYHSNDRKMQFAIERIKADGGSDIIYRTEEFDMEQMDSGSLNFNFSYWQAGNYLYFHKYVMNETAKDRVVQTLTRIDMETGEVVDIKNTGFDFPSSDVCDGNGMYYYKYYVTPEKEYGSLYRVDLNGENSECLIPEVDLSNLLVSDGRIYYIKGVFDEQMNIKEGILCSIGTDGQDNREIAQIDTYNDNAFYYDQIIKINIAGGYIYYTDVNDSGRLYRIGTEGGEPQKICDYEHIRAIDIAAGRLFILYENHNGYIRCVTILPDGSDMVELPLKAG